MDLIFLLGRSNDPHIESLSRELNKIDENHVIIDRIDLQDSFNVKFNNGEVKSEINIRGKVYRLDKIKSVWNYSPIQVVMSRKINKKMSKFVREEWIEGIVSLWNIMDGRWVNDPNALINASNRLGQLRLAADVGLQTPKTLITNDKNRFLDFFNDCKSNIVAKTLHGSEGVPHNGMIYTTKILRKDLQYADKLVYAPCIFQEHIPKKTELRITIIGNTLKVAEIQSQRSRKTMHDWRRYDTFTKTPYRKATIPMDEAHKLLRLMKALNLEFGAVDMIKTPNNELVFLEINPNGAWLWIEQLTGMKISKDIAHLLADNRVAPR